jgi:hypothetical protein
MNPILMSSLHWIVLGAQMPAPSAPVITTPQDVHTTLSLVSMDGRLRGQSVTDNGNLIGLVGDAISLAPGKHQLRLPAQHGYSLHIGLAVDASGARVVSHAATPRFCGMVHEVTWVEPFVATFGKKGQAAEMSPDRTWVGAALRISTPTFGAQLRKAECPSPRALSCDEKHSTVRFTSNPAGAQIWIDDKMQEYPTPATLSVPYCRGRETVRVMLRTPGMVTCPQDIKLRDAATVDVGCTLRTVVEPERPKPSPPQKP